MAGGSFFERTRQLAEDVGDGRLVGRVEVDQVYAHYQHEGIEFKHPEGGQAKYLEQPFYSSHQDYLRTLAKHAFGEGKGLQRAMADNMENLSNKVFEHAPFEFGDLKASGHPSVTSGGETVYDRPPNMHRLTDEELRIKGHLRGLGLGNDYR